MLEVQDDGGSADSPIRPNNGLRGIQERTQLVDGEADFTWAAGGFRVRVRVPLHVGPITLRNPEQLDELEPHHLSRGVGS